MSGNQQPAAVHESLLVFDAETISSAIDRVASAIEERCAGEDWVAMCVMNGGLMFMSELMKRLTLVLRLDAIRVSRYHDTTQGRDLKWHTRPETNPNGRNILLVDAIFDEGETLAAVARYFTEQGAKRVVPVVLLEKAHDRKVSHFRPDIVGLTCPDYYVFGFGMDFEGLYRNLPEIRRLNQ